MDLFKTSCLFPFFIISSFISSCCLAQTKEPWISKPRQNWPQVAMINEVWYQNGERYVHPSFEYAATGFLVDTGKDTLAVTAKHILWIAKTKAMKSVDFMGALQKWMMHPKNNLADSIVIDQLINADSTEVLQGKSSTVTQRDWIVFSTKYRSPHIQPLKPRYTKLNPGEQVFIFGCPYQEPNCVIYEAKVIETPGNRIILTSDSTQKVGGASGSAIVDANGFLIGILGGSSVNNATGEPALYGISTRYLQKVLAGQKDLNVPLIPISEVLMPLIEKSGVEKAVDHFKSVYANPENHFKYEFSDHIFNAMGQTLLDSGKPAEAAEVLNAGLSIFKWNFNTWNLLGSAYEKSGKTDEAKKAYRQSILLNPEDKMAKEKLEKL